MKKLWTNLVGLVFLLLLASLSTSCSMKINLTQAQKRDQERDKLMRFRMDTHQRNQAVASIILGITAGEYYKDNIQKHPK